MSASLSNVRPQPARPPLRLTDPQWYARLGQVARAVGTDSFLERLVALYGSVIGHDSAWIIRYSRNLTPDVLYTSDVPKHVVDLFTKQYYHVDPFSNYWRTVMKPGVIVLRDAMRLSPGSEIYGLLFQIKARISDELAMFFPVIGHSSIALFIERAAGQFSAADEARARLVFPALEGLHRAHVSRLFLGLGNTSESDTKELIQLPTLIIDRFGRPAFTSTGWREAERRNLAIRAAVEQLKSGSALHHALHDGLVLRVEVFDKDFALAPGGRMFVLEHRPQQAPPVRPVEDGLGKIGKITRREREILSLILAGRTTGEIAQQLRISKGTIKNYRLRLYRKVNVTSERALVNLFRPLLNGAELAQPQAQDGHRAG